MGGGGDERVVLAMITWLAEGAKSDIDIACGERKFTLERQGRHCDIFHIVGDKVKRYQIDYSKETAAANTCRL